MIDEVGYGCGHCLGCIGLEEGKDVKSFYVVHPQYRSNLLEVRKLVFKRDSSTFGWKCTCDLNLPSSLRFFNSFEEAVLSYAVLGIDLYAARSFARQLKRLRENNCNKSMNNFKKVISDETSNRLVKLSSCDFVS